MKERIKLQPRSQPSLDLGGKQSSSRRHVRFLQETLPEKHSSRPRNMSLVDAPTLSRSAHPARTAVLPSEAYVLALAQLSSHYAASSSAPTNKIYLYDKSDLAPSGQLAGHEGAITAMRSVPRFASTAAPTLVSSGKDGLVKVWDERSGSVGLQSQYPLVRAAEIRLNSSKCEQCPPSQADGPARCSAAMCRATG